MYQIVGLSSDHLNQKLYLLPIFTANIVHFPCFVQASTRYSLSFLMKSCSKS